MAERRIRCSDGPGSLLDLEAQVQRIMSVRGTGKGSRRIQVQCCVERCHARVRKLRLHIRKSHKQLCSLSCSDCEAVFVGQNDLNNHYRNGCPRRKQKNVAGRNDLNNYHNNGCPRRKLTSQANKHTSFKIETFFRKVDFSDRSAVNTFITNELQLNEASRNAFSEAVDKLYEHLRGTFSVNKLVKGGSVGKGTAVEDKADIDCVIFLNNMKNMEEHKRNLPKTKKRLKSCLKQSEHQITFDGMTPFAVKFKLRLPDSSREFDVDLLPTFTTDLSREQLYDELIDCATENKTNCLSVEKAYYSAHFVSLQVEFVGVQPSLVKDLIRLVKYWRKTCIDDKSIGKKTRLPSSYPLELITIACWENAGSKPSFDIRAGFNAVLQQLVDYCHIHVVWYKYYNKAVAKRGITGMTMTESRQPFVLDPANPTNNVCIRGERDVEGWKIVANVAEMTLQMLKHALMGISFDGNWQIEQV